MIEGDSFGASLGAILTGVAVTSGPWLLTTGLLVLMRASAVTAGVDEVTVGEQVITIVYAVVIVLSAPIDIVLTRFCADCVYQREWSRILAPLCRALAFTAVTFMAVGALALYAFGVPFSLALPGTILAAIVGAQWLLLSAASGLSSPGIILRAFAWGAPVSVIAWFAVVVPLGLGPLGYLLGFGAGQVITLGLLLRGTLQVLPEVEDPTAKLGSAVRKYFVNAVAAFAFNAGLWVDKLCVVLLAGGIFASQYAALAAVAWLSIVPAIAYLFLVVETSFHRRFHGFYSALSSGASLSELEARAADLREQVKDTLCETGAVQLCVALPCAMLAPAIVEWLGLHAPPSQTIFWLLLGASLQVIAFSATLLLYYFDYRYEALITSLTQLVTNTVFTLYVGAHAQTLGSGYAIACAITAAVSVYLLLARLPALLPRTFQSQPDISEA